MTEPEPISGVSIVLILFIFIAGICAIELINLKEPVRVEIVSPPISDQTRMAYCAKDFQCIKLAEALVYEARSGGEIGMIDVGNVVLNRLDDDRWPNDVYTVVHDPKQFSYLRDMYRQKMPDQEDWERALKISFMLLNKELDDTTGGAVYYHSEKIKRPYSFKKYKYLFKRNGHRYYK